MNAFPPKLASQIALLSYDVQQEFSSITVPKDISKHFKFDYKDVKKGSTGGFFGDKILVLL
ncbi:hypothetical protein MSP8887_00189 [Marinomonas spartinae]|uniref:hypothetical protein n=1 Tax=Marinomonas spartinae TaxID=1792290 RepID=UPI000808E27A|nr:hypothetical protein [Marinomonas spartinae]SBS25400.1 hypothetical protein MSP8887_00189 [Marinomonas spartinae]